MILNYLVGNKTYALNFTTGFVADGVGYLLGARVRQVRMPAEDCKLPAYLQQYFPDCIDEYNGNEEDANSYPIGWSQTAVPFLNPRISGNSEFVYQSANVLEGNSQKMTLTTYSAGGYIGDLGTSFTSGMNEFVKLYISQWIDLQSRNVILEVLFFNPTTELFSSVQLAFEFFSGGNILTWSQINTLRLDKYSGLNGIPIILFQLLCLIFIIFYVIRGTVSIIKQRLNFFSV